MDIQHACDSYGKSNLSYSSAFFSLFLGGFLGAHHFYLNRLKSGIVMFTLFSVSVLFTFLFFQTLLFKLIIAVLAINLVWMIVDLFLIRSRVRHLNHELLHNIKSGHHKEKSCDKSKLNCVLYYLSLIPVSLFCLISMAQVTFFFSTKSGLVGGGGGGGCSSCKQGPQGQHQQPPAHYRNQQQPQGAHQHPHSMPQQPSAPIEGNIIKQSAAEHWRFEKTYRK